MPFAHLLMAKSLALSFTASFLLTSQVQLICKFYWFYLPKYIQIQTPLHYISHQGKYNSLLNGILQSILQRIYRKMLLKQKTGSMSGLHSKPSNGFHLTQSSYNELQKIIKTVKSAYHSVYPIAFPFQLQCPTCYSSNLPSTLTSHGLCTFYSFYPKCSSSRYPHGCPFLSLGLYSNAILSSQPSMTTNKRVTHLSHHSLLPLVCFIFYELFIYLRESWREGQRERERITSRL